MLVNTEEIHYQAYRHMLLNRGIDLHWDFNRYCQAAHYDAHALKEQLYIEYPELKKQEPKWEILYAEKKACLHRLLTSGTVQLMPGVSELLHTLILKSIPCCVVTHSPSEIVNLIKKEHPILQQIPHWITREHYSQPKPHSECYLKAIELLAKPHDAVIGFEDTPRGLTALLGTRATPVLICQAHYPEILDFKKRGALHFASFNEYTKHS